MLVRLARSEGAGSCSVLDIMKKTVAVSERLDDVSPRELGREKAPPAVQRRPCAPLSGRRRACRRSEEEAPPRLCCCARRPGGARRGAPSPFSLSPCLCISPCVAIHPAAQKCRRGISLPYFASSRRDVRRSPPRIRMRRARRVGYGVSTTRRPRTRPPAPQQVMQPPCSSSDRRSLSTSAC